MQSDDSEVQLNDDDEKQKRFSERFEKLISKTPSKWMEQAEWREKNRIWLDVAFHIAMNILEEMDKQNLTKHDLVNRSGLPLELINNILKGKENIDLKTISMLEEAFDDKVDLLNRTLD